jgi:hypothetical protein
MGLAGRAALVALTVSLAAANPAAAQVSTVKGKGKMLELVEIARLMEPNTNVTAYTVPAGRRLVITDILVYNTNATAIERGGLYRAPSKEIFAAISVPASGTFAHSFTTGLAFESGVGVGIDNQGAGEGLFTLTGYLTKP